MKITLNTYDVAGRLMDDENAAWSRNGAYALAQHLEQIEEDCEEEMEFDLAAIRRDWSEWDSLQEWAADYFLRDWRKDWRKEVGAENCEDDNTDVKIREYINDHGQLIEFEGGIIVSSF